MTTITWWPAIRASEPPWEARTRIHTTRHGLAELLYIEMRHLPRGARRLVLALSGHNRSTRENILRLLVQNFGGTVVQSNSGSVMDSRELFSLDVMRWPRGKQFIPGSMQIVCTICELLEIDPPQLTPRITRETVVRMPTGFHEPFSDRYARHYGFQAIGPIDTDTST